MENENRKSIIKDLVEKGKTKGTLTYKEIINAFEKIEMDPEQIDKVYEALENMGV